MVEHDPLAGSPSSSDREAEDADEWEPEDEEVDDSDVDIISRPRAGASEHQPDEVEVESSEPSSFVKALQSFYRSRGRVFVVSSTGMVPVSVGAHGAVAAIPALTCPAACSPCASATPSWMWPSCGAWSARTVAMTRCSLHCSHSCVCVEVRGAWRVSCRIEPPFLLTGLLWQEVGARGPPLQPTTNNDQPEVRFFE